MSLHVTKYQTENGKTRKVKGPAKSAGKGGVPGTIPGAENKSSSLGTPAKKE